MVGEAATGAEAVALARARRPDVVLMDIRGRDRAQLVVLAYQTGLVSPTSPG